MLAKQDNAIKTAAFFMESYAEDSPEMQQYLYDRQRAINREKHYFCVKSNNKNSCFKTENYRKH